MIDEKEQPEVVEETPVEQPEVVEESTPEVVEETPTEEAPIEQPKEEPTYDKNVQNWRSLREKAQKAERERDELLKKLQEQQNSHKQQQDDYKPIDDDDLASGKDIKRIEKQQAQRIAQLEQQVIESKLKSQYPDFDEVVNQDTLGMLQDVDPELAESLASNPNLYSKAVAVYKSIKRYGFAPDGPNNPQAHTRNKETVNKNVAKPRTVTSISPQQADSPLSRANAFANGLTDELKEQRWKEAQEILKNS